MTSFPERDCSDTVSLVTPEPSVNDREPAAPDRTSTLDGILSGVRLEGAVFLRGEYTEGWCYESPTGEQTAELLRPGSGRVALFHLVTQGRCWVSTGGGEKHWADTGDLFVLPYGDQHMMGGMDPAEPVPMVTIVDAPPWAEMPVVRHGGGGSRTDVVCGYLQSDDVLFDPVLAALPPLFVVSPPAGSASAWMRASMDYALDQTVPATAGGLEGPAPHLTELLVREALRLHIADTPSYESAWLAALRDPVLSPALAAIHTAPGAKWTVAGLAREAGVSESLLDERFREVLHIPPIRYLTGWRMHVALNLLRSTDLGIGAIARRIGYESEEAFSRAFKRAHGSPPSTARARPTR